MPEVRFGLRWPDGTRTACYSPSTVIREFLPADTTLTVAELVSRSAIGFEQASQRVEARYGYRCTSAAAQTEAIRRDAARFGDEERVTVIATADP